MLSVWPLHFKKWVHLDLRPETTGQDFKESTAVTDGLRAHTDAATASNAAR